MTVYIKNKNKGQALEEIQICPQGNMVFNTR